MKVKILFVLLCLMSVVCMSAQEVRDTVVTGPDWRYEGQWPEGEGVRYSAEGLIKGHFVKGVAEGMCLSSSADCQQIYYGEFKNGKRDGYGRLARPAGFFYEGVFKDGYPEGVGTMFFSAAFVFKGTFHLGKPVDGSYYHMKSKSDMKEHIPDFPEVELTKGQKKILKNLQKQKTKSVETADKSLLESPKFFGESPNLFSKWVNGMLEYPSEAKLAKREGDVRIRFDVTESGELADPYVISGSGNASLDCEALRVVLLSPEWTPGTRDGKPVTVTYSFPIYFRLKAN